MKEIASTLPAAKRSAMSTVKNDVNQEFLRKYSFGRRVPKRPPNTNRDTPVTILPKPTLEVLEVPSKGITVVEGVEVKGNLKLSTETEHEIVKSISKPGGKAEPLSEAAILRSVLKPQGVPVPIDKVGKVREPQVIVRKFNIPIVCSKFTKLKERWKYQHDVVGMANVNPNNPLHTIMKSKPVVSYSVASFVNDPTLATALKSTNVISSTRKLTTTVPILPKTLLVNPNQSPSSSTSNVSLPSTPTAVVKPVQVLPSKPSANSLDSEKFLYLKTMDDSKNSSINSFDKDCEIIEAEGIPVNQTSSQPPAITSPPHVTKPRTIILQGTPFSGTNKESDPQSSVRYLNPYAEIKDKRALNMETVEMMDTKEVIDLSSPIPEEMESDSNTLHLEILSGGNLSESGDVEMVDPPVQISQDENVLRMASKSSDSNIMDNIGQSCRIAISHQDNSKPFFIKVPASGNGSIAQLVLKPQSAPITVQTATPAPILVSASGERGNKTSIVTSVQQPDGSIIPKTIQLTPVALTNAINGLQHKPLISDQSAVLLKSGDQKTRNEVLFLKSLPSQTISLTPGKLPAPLIVTAKSEGALPLKVKNNEVVVLKPVHLQNGGTPVIGGSDSVKSNNLALLNTRQSIALQYQRDLMKSQEEIHIPRGRSYPARHVEVVDCATQTSLFSLLEQGRLVEMTISTDMKGVRTSSSVVMPSTVQPTSSTSKPSTSVPMGKRLVSVNSNGRVMMIGGSSSSSLEPLCKKLKIDQSESNSGNILRLISSNKFKQTRLDSSLNQNINLQNIKNIKNINELMACDVVQKQNVTIDTNPSESRGFSNCSKLELNGVEAMVVDPSDLLSSNSMQDKKSQVPSMKLFLKAAYKDWTNCLIPNEDGNVPLHLAVLDEDLNQVKRQCYVLAARKESVDIRNLEKQTPLHLAVWLGCPKIVDTLLKFNAQPDIVDDRGDNALHHAVAKTSNFECLDLLLEKYNCRAFINVRNYDGYCPLHLCSLYGKCDEAVALVKKGANINIRDAKSGRTALFHAVEARNSELSRILVQYGASASVANYAGQTPLLATNDMSMLGERAMASVIMSRNSLARSKDRVEHLFSSIPSAPSDQSWKSEPEDR